MAHLLMFKWKSSCTPDVRNAGSRGLRVNRNLKKLMSVRYTSSVLVEPENTNISVDTEVDTESIE